MLLLEFQGFNERDSILNIDERSFEKGGGKSKKKKLRLTRSPELSMIMDTREHELLNPLTPFTIWFKKQL